MLWAGHDGELELRRSGGGHRLRGRFPYGRAAVLSDGGRTGRPRKERIASRAFRYRVEEPGEDIHLLVGHSYDRPLASKLNGTLKLRDADDALTFDATISDELAEVSWVRDAMAAVGAGLILGISPGFRMPPERAVPKAEAEEISEEPVNPDKGEHGAIIRTVKDALLYELSLVTRPAYPEAQVEARNWTPGAPAEVLGQLVQKPSALNRWRL